MGYGNLPKNACHRNNNFISQRPQPFFVVSFLACRIPNLTTTRAWAGRHLSW